MRIGKITLVIITVVFLMLSLCIATYAEDDIFRDNIEQSGINELFESADDETKEILNSLGIDEVSAEELYSVSPKKIITAFISILTGRIRNPMKLFVTLSVISIFASLTNSLTNEKNSEVFSTAFLLLTAVCSVIPATECITLAASALSSLSFFMLSFIPVFVFLLSSSGNITQAANFNTLIFSLGEFIIQISDNLMLPISGIYIAFNIASGINPLFPFKSFSKSVNKIISVCLALISTVFVGILSLKGNIASSIDAVTVRSIKTVTGAVIPFIGSALGDAYSSILGSLQLINSTVGFLAIIIIFSMIIPVIAELFMWYLCFHFSSVISEAFDCKTKAFTDAVASAVSVVNTVIIFTSAVFIISIGLMLKTRA